MSNHSHGCETCAKTCIEAKESLKKLQKKFYVLTIVCTCALTLLGEQGTKAVLSTLNAMNDAMASAEGKPVQDKKDPVKTSFRDPIEITPWSPKPPIAKEEQGKFDKEDLVAVENKKLEQQEKQADITVPSIPQKTIQNIASLSNQNLSIETPINANLFNITDTRSAFLTPSTLPFDVYSTTLGLGINYGFGEYYGMGSLNPGLVVPEPPGPEVLTFTALGIITAKSRKR